MPLTLSLAVPSAPIAAHEGLKVEVRSENGGARPAPRGECGVRAVSAHPAADVALRSEPVRVVVTDSPLRSLSAYRDNPVLDRLALLLEADGGPAPTYYLPLPAASRPLAAW